jgi:Mce-associated membrane protein
MAGVPSRVRGLILPVLAGLLLLFAGMALWQERASAAREDASRESVAAATAAARAIFSYDHKGFDAAVRNGVAFTTGDFTREYEQTTGALREAVMSEQAVVRAEVSAAGVVSATADRVEVLLYVNQFRKNVNIEGEKMDQNRVVLTMLRTPGGWRVVQAAAI